MELSFLMVGLVPSFLSFPVCLQGMLLLTLSVTLHSLRPPPCPALVNCEPASTTQVSIFYFALYVIAVGVGGMKPCLSALGGDQFNEDDDDERPMKRSFFNYWWLSIAGGGLVSLTMLVYVEDHVGFGWGYGIPTVGLGIAILIFFSGTPRYRHKRPSGSPLTQVAQVLVAAVRNYNVVVPSGGASEQLYDVYEKGKRNLAHTNTLRFLDKAATPTQSTSEVAAEVDDDADAKKQLPENHADPEAAVADFSRQPAIKTTSVNPWRLCSMTQVEEVKLLVRVLPVWFATLMFLVVVAQLSTLFLRQGISMDLSMGPHFKIPPASLELFGTFTVLAAIPLYDKCLVPLVRGFTGNERGFTMLQRMGVGLFLSIFVMIAAALVETKRLKAVDDNGLQDLPGVTVPITVFWLAPQYSLLGLAQVFAYIGQLEFFYDQAPDNMQSLGTALFETNTGVAQFLTTALVRAVVSASSRNGHQGWIVDNINRCRIDRFYWLLAAMSAANLLLFIVVAKWYTYKTANKQVFAES
jgi:peptide/histidine transporter 3/4